MKKIDSKLKKRVLKRDNFTCQKCKIQDKTARILEVHHIIPLVMKVSDNLDNIITLCNDCHHFAPNDIKAFEEYMKDEMEGTLTILMKIWKNVQKK
jgi:5-methylcytosine-specific restriction endonuclease McrA